MARCPGVGPSILSGGIARSEGRTAMRAWHPMAWAHGSVGLFIAGKPPVRMPRLADVSVNACRGIPGWLIFISANGELCGLAVAGEAAEWICVLPSGAESVDGTWGPGRCLVKGSCADGWQEVRKEKHRAGRA